MNRLWKNRAVLVVFTLVYSGLALAFVVDGYRSEPPVPPLVARLREITPLPLRISAEDLIKNGGDTSVLACYACHDEKKKPQVPLDEAGRVIMPVDHQDLIFSMRNCVVCHTPAHSVEIEYDADGNTLIPPAHAGDIAIAHGGNGRNSSCFNCHNPDKLDQLVTRDGTTLKLEEATLLCASCHGPTYRDWEAGIHGRTTGYWRRDLGPARREGCASCHDPHAPAFPQFIPRPGPVRRAPHP